MAQPVSSNSQFDDSQHVRDSGYSPDLYNSILEHHQSTGGKMGLLLDVGCGTGDATRVLGRLFDMAIGVDNKRDKIDRAMALGGATASGRSFKYHAGDAEDVDSLRELADTQADLLIAMSSAHWFELQRFWAAAASVIRPGGTVALWTDGPLSCRPSTPHAVEIQQILTEFEDVVLKPYMLKPKLLAHTLYKELPLPWDLSVSGFDESTFVRKEQEICSRFFDEKRGLGGAPFGKATDALECLRHFLDDSSVVTRWKASNPELVGTDEDCVEVVIDRIRHIIAGSGGADKDAKTMIGLKSCLLLIKRSP